MKSIFRYGCAAAFVLLLGLRLTAGEAKAPAAASVRPRACVIDMDGTIADESARRAKAEKECPKEKDSKGYYRVYFDPALIASDTPSNKAREVLTWVSGQGVDIYYVSSRSQQCLEASTEWIEDNKFPKGKGVYHREGFKKTTDYKTDTIRKIQCKADVLFGVGDRESDMDVYKSRRIKPIQVEVTSDKSWESARVEIEKIISPPGGSK
ncbi:MAG: hypothetical protein NT045_04410 [Candidatus Aureabacteria bacterium]|nr:hypothetical protein [Candidatus Auribacterota bacterium]